jgi:ankyrin repeat protein
MDGHTESVNMLIKAGANVNCIDRFGNTPLMLATENGHIEIVKLLIKQVLISIVLIVMDVPHLCLQLYMVNT